MGTSLAPIGNHTIVFGNRTFKEIANEIKEKLNGIRFVNESYLLDFALHWNSDSEKRMATIKETTHWNYYDEDDSFNFEEDRKIEFCGPFDLEIWVEEFRVLYFNPPFRYHYWMKYSDEEDEPGVYHRNEWRKYFFQIQQALGGDRVIYLADNSHPLAVFFDSEGPFNEIETNLSAQFGPPSPTMEEAYDTDGYFIDYLKNDSL